MLKNRTCNVPDHSQDQDSGVKHSKCGPCSIGKTLVMLGLLALLGAVLAQLAWPTPADSPGSSVALEGYCPVCVTKMGKWVKGNSAHRATYDGKTYYFPSKRDREMFVSDPAKYVPALGGDCTVCYAKMKKRVPGNIRHAVRHNGRIYLFPSEKEKQAFLRDPSAYSRVDLALDGNCAVCLAQIGKKIPGKSEFTAVHNGLRYLFPSHRERQAFLADPDRFAKTAAAVGKGSPVNHSRRVLTITGKSGCASCQHGVTPIGAPQTLGLAVGTPDGRVYVIEDAHKLYPRVYKDRFAGLSLKVSGEVLREDGKITWIRPTEVIVLN